VYRIVEQGLLNAVDHGGARHVAVAIETRPERIEVTVRDDGQGLDPGYSSGFGTTLIDTWCRTLGGSWSLAPGSDGGGVLTATLPVRSPRSAP